MQNLVCMISKYLVLIFMTLYTIKCFTYFTAKDREKRTSNLNKQIFYIFMIHFLCHVMLLINMQESKIILYYFIEILIAVVYIVTFRNVYKKSSRLLTNNVAFLMLIGYTILLRLSPKLAIRQFILASVGLVITLFIPLILSKLKNVKNWSTFYGIFGIIFLASVFIPGVGKEIYGSRNWIEIAGFSLQPMEFVKIIFIFFVASSLVKVNTLKELVINAMIAATFMLVLVAEKDFGAVLLFYICYFMMVYLATSRPSFMLLGIGLFVFACFAGYVLFKNSLFSHIMVRITAWKEPFKYIDSEGYQISESLFALGTGGFAGTGLGRGMPYIIPVAESDFVFSAISEELGVIFGLALILIYLSSFIAMQNIAMKCKNPFYKYVTFGIAICYIFQVFLNIGGVTKFIPSTGVTLPLISYGVSSVLSTLIMFSIVQYTYILVSEEADNVEKERQHIERKERIHFAADEGISRKGSRTVK
ncbi:MAG TPA: FtsW/RodA/SpoVE family cell cycle protein [Lachnospiraceae bacterium]|nr:FtsW/RodA/SpoVE family cell cycle protein [Eubacterium sp.]HBZ02245.1 FtsW/RodA/SpoVE family cell cycle protein [Lachnospiraceae bacterium]